MIQLRLADKNATTCLQTSKFQILLVVLKSLCYFQLPLSRRELVIRGCNRVLNSVFCTIPYRTAEEKREMVKHIKETIKRSMKAGSSLAAAPAARSSSFRRNNTEDRLNSSDPGPFLRVNSDPTSVFRRSFSHNPESTKNRRSSLESDASHSSEGNADTESISSGTVKERKISLKKKNKAVSPLGVENGLINI